MIVMLKQKKVNGAQRYVARTVFCGGVWWKRGFGFQFRNDKGLDLSPWLARSVFQLVHSYNLDHTIESESDEMPKEGIDHVGC